MGKADRRMGKAYKQRGEADGWGRQMGKKDRWTDGKGQMGGGGRQMGNTDGWGRQMDEKDKGVGKIKGWEMDEEGM